VAHGGQVCRSMIADADHAELQPFVRQARGGKRRRREIAAECYSACLQESPPVRLIAHGKCLGGNAWQEAQRGGPGLATTCRREPRPPRLSLASFSLPHARFLP